jgi:hypothetical protein
MSERKEHNNRNNLRDEKTGKGYGMQGIDKAPGEETSQHEEKIVADTQKAKGKVDGDSSKDSDQPATE